MIQGVLDKSVDRSEYRRRRRRENRRAGGAAVNMKDRREFRTRTNEELRK